MVWCGEAVNAPSKFPKPAPRVGCSWEMVGAGLNVCLGMLEDPGKEQTKGGKGRAKFSPLASAESSGPLQPGLQAQKASYSVQVSSTQDGAGE